MEHFRRRVRTIGWDENGNVKWGWTGGMSWKMKLAVAAFWIGYIAVLYAVGRWGYRKEFDMFRDDWWELFTLAVTIVAFLIVLNWYLRGRLRAQAGTVLGGLWVALVIVGFLRFGILAGIAAPILCSVVTGAVTWGIAGQIAPRPLSENMNSLEWMEEEAGKNEALRANGTQAQGTVGMKPDVPQDLSSVWQEYRRTRSKELCNMLLTHFLPIVRYSAERLAAKVPDEVELDDLISAGTSGLLDAIEAFEPERGIKFETYCAPLIRGAILDKLRVMGWVPRLVHPPSIHLKPIKRLDDRRKGYGVGETPSA